MGVVDWAATHVTTAACPSAVSSGRERDIAMEDTKTGMKDGRTEGRKEGRRGSSNRKKDSRIDRMRKGGRRDAALRALAWQQDNRRKGGKKKSAEAEGGLNGKMGP